MKKIILILLLMSCAAPIRMNENPPVTISVYSRAMWDEWNDRTAQIIANDQKKEINLFFVRDGDTIAQKLFRPR